MGNDKLCTQCGYKLPSAAKFCMNCGEKLGYYQEQKSDQNIEDKDILYKLLDSYIGTANNNFHEDQKEAIESILKLGSKTLVVQKTGWGKSAVYFIAAKYLKLNGRGSLAIVSS